MANIYTVLGNIQGQMDALMTILEKIKFDYNDEPYILGDVIDKGPKSLKCI